MHYNNTSTKIHLLNKSTHPLSALTHSLLDRNQIIVRKPENFSVECGACKSPKAQKDRPGILVLYLKLLKLLLVKLRVYTYLLIK